jgi:hypothetical protein
MTELSEEERMQEYMRQLQEQVVSILNNVKEELGVDTPIEIEVREVDPNE